MSEDIVKEKRSKRIHKEKVIIKKQLKIAKLAGIESKYLTQSHRLSKHHALDCGQSNCIVCGNPRKLYKEKTIQEKRFEQFETEPE